MVNCPKCGVEVITPVKSWTIHPGKEPEIAMGMFKCPNCKASFRAALEVKTEVEETVSIKNMVDRIKGIQGELMQTLKNLREKLKTLETERSNLMIEIEELKKVAESKVSALESEVSMMREEVKSLRDLLGYSDET